MNYLKPEAFFKSFNISASLKDFQRLDVRKLYKLLQQGHTASTLVMEQGANFLFFPRRFYDRLPRCVKFTISEYKFTRLKFDFDDFYNYSTDENIIVKEYCEEMLKQYPSHKKTQKILKDLKLMNPELFI